MAVKRIDRGLERSVVEALGCLAASALATVPDDLQLSSVTWDGVDQRLDSFRVLPTGELELDLISDAQALVTESTAWKAGTLVAETSDGRRLAVDVAISRHVWPRAKRKMVRVHGLAWRLFARAQAAAKPAVWAAPLDFGIDDEPHLLEMGASNLQLRSEDRQAKGWCFDTPSGLAFLIRSIDSERWHLAFQLGATVTPSLAQVVEFAALLAFAIGQPFSIGVFQRIGTADAADMMRLQLPDMRSRKPSRRAPALPAIHGGYWLSRFVELGLHFIARHPSAPLLASIHHQLDALDALLDTELLHAWIAAEILASWGLENKHLKDGASRRIADHNSWVTWVRAHEVEIKAHAVAGMESRLFNAVINAEVNKPTPVQRAFLGEGIAWNDELNNVELARHGVVHEGGMPGYLDARDWLPDIKQVGTALNVHATLVAKLIGYDGPIADRSKRSLPMTRDSMPAWWKIADDYDLVTYSEQQ